MSSVGPLVDASWLADHLDDPRLRVIDFRWQEGTPGRPGYEAGHIPGAVFVDLEAEGSSGVAYCGSGVSACLNLLALEVAGLPDPGSWSDWSTRPDAPVATGDETPQPAVRE